MQKFFLIANISLRQTAFLNHIQERLDITNDIKKADGIIVLGGDGAMLDAIRKHRDCGLPFYGFNFGHVGFLMNGPKKEIVSEIVNKSVNFIQVALLKAKIFAKNGKLITQEFAFNDFYFERATSRTAKFKLIIDGKMKFESLVADGIIAATPAGSTAYNASAGGIILPIDSNSLVVTGICPAIFHNWRTAPISNKSTVTIEPAETEKRPIRFLADGVEIKESHKVEISYSDKKVKIGFGRSYNFGEKVYNLLFSRKI